MFLSYFLVTFVHCGVVAAEERFFVGTQKEPEMENQLKVSYCAPWARVIEAAQGRAVCQSGTDTDGTPKFNAFKSEEEW